MRFSKPGVVLFGLMAIVALAQADPVFVTASIPDPVINGGCTNGGPPCTFAAGSTSGVDQVAQGWTYSWSVSGPAAASPSSSSTNTFSPAFTVTGTYTVTLAVTNSVGSTTAQKTQVVTVAGPVCPAPNANSLVFIAFHNPSSSCTQNSGTCSVGESIAFSATGYNYDFSCGAHTFSWNFGDGSSTVSGKDVTHTYSGGSYTVQLTITNPSQNWTVSQNIVVGGATPPPTPTPSGCGTMRPGSNVFVSYHDQNFTCTQNGGSCPAGAAIFFAASAFGDYDFNCGAHAFFWTFGDGQQATGQSPTHLYAASGTYNVSCSVAGPNGSATLTATVTVAGPPTPTPPCGQITMTPPTLPVVSVGGNFNETLTPSGGASPYSIFLVAGALPPGLSFLVNSISGTPTAPGTFSFSFHVVDSRGCGAVLSYVITVTNSAGCPLMVGDGNVFLTFKGVNSHCSESATVPCDIAEPIEFVASAIGYSFNCFNHAFTWNFGDGELAGGDHATHEFRQSGIYNVTLTISNAQQALQLTKSVVVGGARHRAVRR